MTDRAHELNGFTEAINDGPATAKDVYDLIEHHSHRCQNCGDLLEHDLDESCAEFVADITRECEAIG